MISFADEIHRKIASAVSLPPEYVTSGPRRHLLMPSGYCLTHGEHCCGPVTA